jgi:hypothetical protein
MIMATSKVTPIRPNTAPAKASADWRQAASQIKLIIARTDAAQTELARVTRMLRMLGKIADSDVLGDDETTELDGIGETLGCIAEIVSGVSNQIDSATLLAPESAS